MNFPILDQNKQSILKHFKRGGPSIAPISLSSPGPAAVAASLHLPVLLFGPALPLPLDSLPLPVHSLPLPVHPLSVPVHPIPVHLVPVESVHLIPVALVPVAPLPLPLSLALLLLAFPPLPVALPAVLLKLLPLLLALVLLLLQLLWGQSGDGGGESAGDLGSMARWSDSQKDPFKWFPGP